MNKISYILFSALTLLMAACSGRGKDISPNGNSVYYWRTSFALDKSETDFLIGNNVKKMYIRYFDVVPTEGSGIMPNATITFNGKIPHGVSVIPVIYIMEESLKYDTSVLGKNIVDRILQINATNDIYETKEIQIDCDWTSRSQNKYFALLRDIRKYAALHYISLSATIRLHQLSMQAPPVDYGTLMMYNTGDVKDPRCSNPILRLRDVAPYLKNLGSYPLKMNVAYPIFSWRLVYRSGHFVGFMHGNDIETYPGDKIVTMQCSAKDILKVKQAVIRERPSINNNVILYTLDKCNIKRYKNDEIKEIYSH
ncbi:hypothetical protein [Xylanibacter oryzae]|uniref:hypothetical protein n=1 Tax=Xylanibacter oryzae TaxID=185293 RepID=UPI00056B104B|nr:hypothetical protein [Xylanibacter oryzae]